MLAKLPNQDVAPGFALDLTTTDEHGEPWGFTKKEMREKARALLIETEPILLVGSPECKEFSSWKKLNNLRRDSAEVRRRYLGAMVHHDHAPHWEEDAETASVLAGVVENDHG